MNAGRRWATIVSVLLGLSAWMLGTALHTALAGYSPASTFGSYSYTDSSCSTITDPVSVVFTFGSGWYDDPYQHARLSDHGSWTYEDGAGQYFYDDYGCSSTDDGAATGNGSSTRYHMRWETAATVACGQSYAATPHFENWVQHGFGGEHCVPPYGFSQGRSKVTLDFFNSGHYHTYTDSNYWGNTTAILKCDGDYASNNGYVYYIDLR